MSSAHITFDFTGDKVADRVAKMRSSAVRDLFSAATSSDVISLSGGMPDVSLLPQEAIQKAVEAACGDRRALALQYTSTDGLSGMREVVCDLVRDLGIRCRPDDVILTTGAQEALDLVAKVFINPGDTIIAEGPTYLGALQAFSAYEPDIRCVPLDDEGLRMDLLEEELKRLGKGAVKFLYTIPNFHNPAGVTMIAERRARLVELAEEYDFLIVEDDPYGRLRFEGDYIMPLKALSDKVIYLGTVSKVFAPGLRTGWIIAPKCVLARINLVKQGTDLCGSAFNMVVVEHYFRDTPWQETLQSFIETYRERRDAMLEALDEFFPPEARWTHPEGGLFVWVTLPEYADAGSILSVALENGVTYTPGDSFYPNGAMGKNCMRLAFCFASPDKIREAIRRLGSVVNERLGLYRAFLEAGAIRGPKPV
ncbi:MAG: PLP-dependent aminotransferase family protein [Eggerthellaceae bacterium]|nr:PLP-dependent aminotransferase family protein [Eggerthellaceae bacterium]